MGSNNEFTRRLKTLFVSTSMTDDLLLIMNVAFFLTHRTKKFFYLVTINS